MERVVWKGKEGREGVMIVDLRIRHRVSLTLEMQASLRVHCQPAGQLKAPNEWTKGLTPEPIEKLRHRRP